MFLEAWVNTFGVYSVDDMSKMQIILLVTFFIFFAICGVACVKLAIQVQVIEGIYL